MEKEIDRVEIQQQLKETMEREIQVMRELLSEVHEEQHALLNNNVDALKAITLHREEVMQTLLQHRQRRIDIVKALTGNDATEEEALPELLEGDDVLKCGILSLRDQLLELLLQVQQQTSRNNYLIHHRVALTKNLINKLHPANKNATYNNAGTLGGGRPTATVTLINREG